MCGRLSLSAPNHRAAAEMLADAVPDFEIEGLARWLEGADYRPRHNVGPGQDHWLVRGRGRRAILDRGRWGLSLAAKPSEPSRSPKLVINARAETLDVRPMFSDALVNGRCLIPADGFFEWERREGQRQPWWFHRRDGRGLLFAALARAPERADDQGSARFAIVTVAASEELRWIHERMPAIIESSEVATWLFGPAGQALELLRSSETELESRRVSPRYNRVAHDEPIEQPTSKV